MVSKDNELIPIHIHCKFLLSFRIVLLIAIETTDLLEKMNID